MNRLSKSFRESLCNFAQRSIVTEAETKEVEKIYPKISAAIKAEIDKKFPPNDMAVLQKYDVAQKDLCINNRYGFRDDMKFSFHENDLNAPVLPKTGCNSREFAWSEKTATLLQSYNMALDAQKKAAKTKVLTATSLLFNIYYGCSSKFNGYLYTPSNPG